MCRKCERMMTMFKWRAWRDLIAEGSWVVWELEQAAGRADFTREQAREMWSKMGEKAREVARQAWDSKGKAWGSALREIERESELKARVEAGKAHMCSIGLGAFVGATPASSLSAWGAIPDGVRVEWGGEPAATEEPEAVNGQLVGGDDSDEGMMV